MKCCVPLHYLRREKREEKGRKFYIYPDVTHTLDKNGSLYDPSGTESCDMQIRLVSYLDKDEQKLYIYRTTVATSCDL